MTQFIRVELRKKEEFKNALADAVVYKFQQDTQTASAIGTEFLLLVAVTAISGLITTSTVDAGQ